MKYFNLTLLSLLLFSCDGPEIQVHSPVYESIYSTGQNIYINATITDPDGIKRVGFTLFDTPHTTYLDDSLPNNYELHDTVSMINLFGESTNLSISASDKNGNVNSLNVLIKHTF